MRYYFRRKILFLALSAILIPGTLSAQNWFKRPSGFTDYKPPEPTKPTVVVSTGTASSKQNYSSSFMRFWEDLTGDALEDLCKAAQLDLSHKVEFPNDVLGLKVGYKRLMKRFPNNQLALVDEISFKPNLALDIPLSQPLQAPGGAPVSFKLTMNASVEGKSQVVRPLKGEEYCTELKTWAKLYNMKTAWPATKKRISNMKIGEIWKIPMTFHLGIGMEASATPYKAFTIKLSAESGEKVTPSVTLFRMAEDKMRLRVRLGKAVAHTVGASVSSVEIPFEDLALWQTDGYLTKLGLKEVAKQLNNALAAKFSFTRTHFRGKKLVLEFICNPNDPEQLKAMASFLRGDFEVLKRFIELNLDFTNFKEGETVDEAAQELQEMANTANSGLQGSQTYAGASQFDGTTTDVNFQLPLIYKRESEKERTTTSYQAVGSDERMNVYKMRHKVKTGHMNIPFAGSLHKNSRETTSYVVQKEYKDGTTSKPSFMYKEYSGTTLVSAKNAADSIERANEILQYVGTQGEGLNANNVLKVDQALPKTGMKNGKKIKASNAYNSVASEFKLIISEKGVQEIIFAPAAAIMRAVFNVFYDSFNTVLDKAADLFRIDESGKVSFDRKAARQRLGYGHSHSDDADPVYAMKRLAAKATKVIADIFEVKKTSNDKEQAAKFSKLVQGRGTLGAKNFLQVAVQLLDPSEVSATFTMDSKNKKTGKHHYEATVFTPSVEKIETSLKEVQDAESRFDDPSVLTD